MTLQRRGFDADIWLATQAPWTFSAAGRTWAARPIGMDHVTTLTPRLQQANGAQQLRLIRGLLRRAFPWRFSMRWRGDPVSLIMGQPGPALQHTLVDFLQWAGLPVEAAPGVPDAR